MKKVLILAYDFPPYNSIGAQRPFSWFKYIKEFGIQPIIVTRHWDDNIQNPIDYIKPSKYKKKSIKNKDEGITIRVPFKPNLRDKLILRYGINRYIYLRKILTLIYQLCEFNISIFDNRRTIYLAAKEYLQNNSVDIIIATGEPFILFKYANNLSKQFNIPWIADYRDGWCSNYNRSKFERILYNEIEKHLVKTSICITTVSEEFKIQLKKIHNKQVEILKNGYFPELFTDTENKYTERFTITFIGTLYSYQPIEMFADAFNVFCNDTRNCVLNFIGVDFYSEQRERVQRIFQGKNYTLNLTGRIDHITTIEILKNSDLLLLPASKTHDQLYAKVFDYLAVRKKILLFESDNAALQKIITETNSGIICNTKNEILYALKECYNEWQKTGIVKCNSKNIEQYSRKEQTRKLAELIMSLCK